MPASLPCPACGAANPAGGLACAVCGGTLGQEAPRVVEERKLVSVLFADIGGSLALIRGHDPEAAHALLAPAVARMAEAVRRHGGTVAQMLGDGVMALFGAPIAQEDHATAACLAAIAIRDALGTEGGAASARPPRLAVRVGVHSGEVLITTPPPGSGVVLQPTGEVVHVAARLEQTAAPGTAQASLATLRLAGPRIQARALPARRVRGLAAPLATVELIGAAEPAARLAPAPTRLVGRVAELAALTRALAGAAESARFLRLEGPPGSGKSRLASELAQHAARGGIALAALACQPHAEAPLAPLRRLLPSLPQGAATAPDPAALAVLLDPQAADAAWRREEPAIRRARILAAGAARIRAAADAAPLMLLVEDAHWLEPESAAAVALLAALPPAPGLFVLATARPDEWPAALPAQAWSRIVLAPLDEAEASALAADLLRDMTGGIDARMAERLVAQLVARAGGNPFFAEQIAAAWREGGPGGGPLPGRLRGVLAARIDRLAPGDKGLAELAAVFGGTVAPALLAEALALAPAACDTAIARLREAGLFGPGEPGAEARFAHDLLRETVESGLTRGRRQALHATCLRAITRLHADRLDAEAVRLLRHAEGADLPAEAVLHARAAARQAMAAYANEAAVRHYDQALAAVARLPDDANARRTRLELLLALRDPLFRQGDIARIRASLREAAGLAAQLEDESAQAQVAILSSHAHWMAGDPVAALVDAGRAAQMAQERGDAPLALRARFQVALTHLATGALHEAAAAMGAVASALADGSVAHGRYGLDHSLAATASGYQARALAETGALEEAARAAEASEAAALRDGRPFARIFASLAATAVATAGGDFAAATARCTGAVEWCRAADSRLMRPVALHLLGQARLGASDPAGARAALAEAVDLAEAMGFLIHQGQRMALLAEAELAMGEAGHAARHATRARSLAQRCGERVAAASAQRMVALCAAARGDMAAARRGLLAAGRAAQAAGLAALAGRCAAEAARFQLPRPAREATRRSAG